MSINRLTPAGPQWAASPPTVPESFALPLRRVPPKGVRGLVILSDHLIGCYTHYFAGRTQPCQTGNCDACNANNQRRWHGYLLVWNPTNGYRLVLELSHHASAQLAETTKTLTTLRTLAIAARRVPEKPNGKIILEIERTSHKPDELPPPIDTAKYLLHLWGVKRSPLKTDPLDVDTPAAIVLNNGASRSG